MIDTRNVSIIQDEDGKPIVLINDKKFKFKLELNANSKAIPKNTLNKKARATTASSLLIIPLLILDLAP